MFFSSELYDTTRVLLHGPSYKFFNRQTLKSSRMPQKEAKETVYESERYKEKYG